MIIDLGSRTPLHIPSPCHDIEEADGIIALPDDGAPDSRHCFDGLDPHGIYREIGRARDLDPSGKRHPRSHEGIGLPAVVVGGVFLGFGSIVVIDADILAIAQTGNDALTKAREQDTRGHDELHRLAPLLADAARNRTLVAEADAGRLAWPEGLLRSEHKKS